MSLKDRIPFPSTHSCLLFKSLSKAMIVASSCLFAVLASFAHANNIRTNVAKPAVPLDMHPREAIAKIVHSKTGAAFGHFPDSEALKNFRVVEQGENSINPLDTASFFTTTYRQDGTCDSTKPIDSTRGYLTETCFTPVDATAITFSSYAYRCNTSKSCLIPRVHHLTRSLLYYYI